MRVLMFGWEYPPHITGGLGTACAGITRALADRKIDILFVVPKIYGDENNNRIKIVGAEKVNIKKKKKHPEIGEIVKEIVFSKISPYPGSEAETPPSIKQGQKKTKFIGGYGPNLMNEVLKFAQITADIAKNNYFDIIHVHDWPTFPAGIVAHKISGKPLVVHVHATEFDRSGDNINPDVFHIEKMGIEAADRIICVSNLTRSIIIDRYGANEKKVFVVHNGVEKIEPDLNIAHKIHFKEHAKVVTFLGRITFQKGPSFFVEAAKRLLEVKGNIHFVMAGNGDLLPAMEKMVKEYGITDHFSFTGFLDVTDVESLLSETDVLVMPSVSEPFGIVPLEAMQKFVPVIISRQSGVSEVLDYAIKVDFWDVDALADAIHGVLNYPILQEFLKVNGNEESNTITWDKAAAKIDECYQSIINQDSEQS